MPGFRKIYCAYHDKQLITNFCVEPNCLMPLCPNCIGAHNQFHKDNGSKSTYNSIDNVLNHTYNSMVGLIKSFENEQKRIENIAGVISEMPGVLHEKLVLARTLAINHIEKTFDKLEKQMLLKLCTKQETLVGPNLKFIEAQLKTINDSLITLQKMTKNIHGDRCLSTVIKFLQNQHEQFIGIRNQLNANVNLFQCVQPFVRIEEQILQHIGPLLRNFITIDFSESSQILNKSESNDTFEVQQISSSISPALSYLRQKPMNQHVQPIKQSFEKAPQVRKERQKFQCDVQIQNLSRKIADMRKNNKLISAALQRKG